MPVQRRARPPGRRTVLVALLCGVGAGASGCGVEWERLRDVRLDDDEPFPPPSPGPDELARRLAVRDADLLRRACLAAGLERPELAAPMAAVADNHARQLDALATDDATAGPGPQRRTTPGPDLLPVPDQLPGAEHDAAEGLMAWLARTSGEMAALLASLAAADAVHARVLAGVLGQAAPERPTPLTDATRTGGGVPVDEDAASAVADALRGEHAAVYGYGVVAARLDGAVRDAAREALADHERVVDELSEVLHDGGREAPAPEPAYELPAPAVTADELRELALLIEERAAALHAGVVRRATGGVRLLGAHLLVGAALRAAYWRGSAVALPGIGD